MKASDHARHRSEERHGRAHSVGTAVRIAMRDGITLPYEDNPGVAMVIARDGRRWVVDLISDSVITSLPTLPDTFFFGNT